MKQQNFIKEFVFQTIKDKVNLEGFLAYVKTLPINSDKVQQSFKEAIAECSKIPAESDP